MGTACTKGDSWRHFPSDARFHIFSLSADYVFHFWPDSLKFFPSLSLFFRGATPTVLNERCSSHVPARGGPPVDAVWTCKPSAFCWVLFLHEALARLPPVRGCCRSHLSHSRTCAGAALPQSLLVPLPAPRTLKHMLGLPLSLSW